MARCRISSSLLPVLALLATVVAVGCQKAEEIVQYSVKKEELPPPVDPAPPIERVKKRTMGAIVQHESLTWYFKLTGLDEPVETHKAAFLKLVSTLKFNRDGDGNPTWTLPEGWTNLPGDDNRFATIRTDSDPPLDISVTALEGDARKTEYLLANINRWRGQIGLPPTGEDNLFSDTLDEEVRRETLNGLEVVLVDIAGQAPKASGGPPFALATGAGGLPPLGPAASPIAYDAPRGWAPGKVGGMRKAAFTVSEGDRKAELTVIDLALVGDLGDWTANVNRWRGQVGLSPAGSEEIAAATKNVAVASIPARMIEIAPGKDKGEAILAAMFVRGQTAWFIKLQGDAALVAREQPKFEQFLQSLRFR